MLSRSNACARRQCSTRRQLTLAGVPFKQVVPTRLRLEDGYVSIADLHWDSLGNAIRASGGANIAAEVPLVDVAVTGGLDLRLLGAFATDIATGGTAQADFTVKGPLSVAQRRGSHRCDERGAPPGHAAPRRVGAGGCGPRRRKSHRDHQHGRHGERRRRRDQRRDRRHDDRRSERAHDDVGDETWRSNIPRGFRRNRTPTSRSRWRPRAPRSAGVSTSLAARIANRSSSPARCCRVCGRASTAPAQPLSPFLSRLRLDLSLASVEDVRIDNNYGRLDLSTRLRIVGSVERPGVIGRIEASPDGEIYLAGNTYRIERLIVDFANPRAIAPDLSFLAETRVGSTPDRGRADVRGERRLRAERAFAGGWRDRRTSRGAALRRVDGPLGRGRAAGAAAVGRGPRDRWPAGWPRYAAAGAGGKRRSVRRSHAHRRRRRPGFAPDARRAARRQRRARVLTESRRERVHLVHDLLRAVRPVVSRAAAGRSEPFARVPPRAALRRDPARADHASARRTDCRRAFHGKSWIPGTRAARQAEADRGRPLPVRGVATRPRSACRSVRDARVSGGEDSRPADSGRGGQATAQTAGAAAVELEYAIERGPETRLDVRGATLPSAVRERILDRWSSTIFDGFLERDARTIVRDHLYREGHLQATIAPQLTADAASGTKTLTIEIDPGPVVASHIEFSGNAHIATSRLVEAADAAGTRDGLDRSRHFRGVDRTAVSRRGPARGGGRRPGARAPERDFYGARRGARRPAVRCRASRSSRAPAGFPRRRYAKS